MIYQGSEPDPRSISVKTEGWEVNASKVGLSPADPSITGPTLLLLVGGQSIVSNFNGPSLINITDAAVQMLHPLDGTLWQAKEPLVGADFVLSNPVSYLARDLRAFGVFPRVIVCVAGVGATAIRQHAPSGKYENSLKNMVNRAKSYGWLNDSRVKHGMIWSQGVSDAIGALNSITQAEYEAYLRQIRSGIERWGWTGPIWVERQTVWNGPSPNAGPVRSAQSGIVDGSLFRSGFDFDTLGPGDKHDGNHLNAIGCQKWADAYRSIITAWATS